MRAFRKKKMLCLALAAAVCLCGCQDSEQGQAAQGGEPHIAENVFDTAAPDETARASFTFGVSNYDEEKSCIPYKGGELEIDFEVAPEECSFECSVLIYIDGILQEYAQEPGGETREQHTVYVDNEKTILPAYFTPRIDPAKKQHRMHFLCMFDPEYRPGKNSTGYGNSHKVSQLLSWKLLTDGEAEKSTDKIVRGRMKAVSKGKDKMDKNAGVEFEFSKGKGEGDVSFRVASGEAGQYRISAYVDHGQAEFSGGAKYVDLSFNGENRYEGTLSVKSYAGEDYGTLYLIAVPISHFGTAMVYKSSSVCLFQGGLWDAEG